MWEKVLYKCKKSNFTYCCSHHVSYRDLSSDQSKAGLLAWHGRESRPDSQETPSDSLLSLLVQPSCLLRLSPEAVSSLLNCGRELITSWHGRT